MSSKNGTSGSSGNGGSTGDGNVMEQVYDGGTTVSKPDKKPKKSEVVSSGITAVSNELGLTNTVWNPNEAATTSNISGTMAQNLTGNDQSFFGIEASKATDDYLVSQGSDYATVGNYFKKEGGNFIRISKQEGEKLYAQGDPNVSRSVMLTKKGQEAKYGSSGGAMGSGDPTGIMSSTAISQPMWESQQNLKQAFGLGVAALGVPMAGSIIYQSAKKPYNEYLKSFYNIQSSTSMASSAKPVDSGTYLAENYGQDDTSGSQDEGTQYDSDTTIKKRKHHAKSGAGGIDVKGYNLFAKTNQTISGTMS
tara:strand:- start:289 stop:1209 length:921 start_codon:yes stop_codon:yes gene_type:complete